MRSGILQEITYLTTIATAIGRWTASAAEPNHHTKPAAPSRFPAKLGAEVQEHKILWEGGIPDDPHATRST
jgi:hypothetical protein